MDTDNRLRELSIDPDLVMEAEEYLAKYYGVKQRYDELPDDVKAKVKEVEELLKNYLENLTCFCNFTTDGQVRYLCDYSYGTNYNPFTGVAYFGVEEIIGWRNEPEDEEMIQRSERLEMKNE